VTIREAEQKLAQLGQEFGPKYPSVTEMRVFKIRNGLLCR